MNLKILLEEIQSLKEKIHRLDSQIEDILFAKEPLSPEAKLLEIPGVGPKTVAAFIGEVGKCKQILIEQRTYWFYWLTFQDL
ncbi:unnamed protein product [marine sediment metagenome]|uniref:Transposase IS116/IS110/IS902 family protein n=1 Tax=marine sediment metagenome TaxID=412755 RepID=X1GTD3_9ZZZZ